MKSQSKLTESDIREHLTVRSVEPYIDPNREVLVPGEPRPAAVLIPMLRNKEKWELLFIRRTSVEGDYHSGQVAFPGGRMDAEDSSPENTALREAQEEIGLDSKSVQILGRLEDIVTITNYRVTPLVGVIPWPIMLTPAPSEVDRIFTIPLKWLSDPENHELRERETPDKKQKLSVIYFDRYDDEMLWGVSAHITLNFLQALGLS